MVSVKDLRLRCGLSQARFAALTGIPRRTIENWECGRVSPAPYLVELLEYWLTHEGHIKAGSD